MHADAMSKEQREGRWQDMTDAWFHSPEYSRLAA
jgi:hypothetical protein